MPKKGPATRTTPAPPTRTATSTWRRRSRAAPAAQWIPIAVPPLVGRELWDRARAQLPRNAVLSFRNNTRRDYLLRCLLTCGGCGLAMHGATWPTPGGERRYYRCGGRDCLRTGRAQPCPRACVDGEALERAVWGHVRELLADPDRLTAQFRHLAAEADRERGPERRLTARLDGLARADARLLDAYQAEVIGLEELAERRRQLAGQRHAFERELERQRGLRHRRAEADEVMADLTAFCARVRGRLDGASFADRQAILQLVVERVIVHEGGLEIRHVIPLHSPPPEREGPSQADGRLRSDRVDQVPGPGGARAGAVTGLGIVGRLDRLPRGLRSLLGPEAHAAASGGRGRAALEVTLPDLPQHRDLGQRPRAFGRSRPVEPVEQGEPVLAHRPRVGLALGRAPRQAAVLDPAGVGLVPRLRDHTAEPVRGDGGELVERGAQGLADQLQPVEDADGGQNVGGVGALPAARLEQAELAAALEQLAEETLLGAALEQPGAELAQDRGVEAGVGQLQPERVLPVDPGAHGFRGPPVGQVLAELQQGGQGQPPRRQPGLAALREEVDEVGVGEDGSQLVTKLEERVALAEGGPGDPCRLLGHGLDRAGLERHGGPPRRIGYRFPRHRPPGRPRPISPAVSDSLLGLWVPFMLRCMS